MSGRKQTANISQEVTQDGSSSQASNLAGNVKIKSNSLILFEEVISHLSVELYRRLPFVSCIYFIYVKSLKVSFKCIVDTDNIACYVCCLQNCTKCINHLDVKIDLK